MNASIRRASLGAALAALAASALLPALAGAQYETEGEHGLFVTETGGEIGVGWLTAGVAAGVLLVTADDSVLLEVETPAAGAHRATFARPGADVVIRYGALGQDPLHATPLFLSEEPVLESGELTGVDSVYVVGDVHGEHDRVRGLLANAGLVDAEGRWSGGRSHVVFLGDVFDRGSEVTRTLWLMYRLEHEARAAGGGAHVVLGNHETMVFTDDLRYVAPKELLVARLHGVSYRELFDIRTSLLGRWLATRPVLMRVDGALLAHGGVTPEVSPYSVAALNDSARSYLAEDLFYRWADTTWALAHDSATAEAVRDRYADVVVMDSASVARRMTLLFDERGVLWYRGYVQSDTLGAALDRALANFRADVHVVGHTPVPTISELYDGRLLAVDLADPALEMLLLTRDADGGRRAWRVGLRGPPEPL
jgi:hypothetical protein